VRIFVPFGESPPKLKTPSPAVAIVAVLFVRSQV